jgi:hypothetical protein
MYSKSLDNQTIHAGYPPIVVLLMGKHNQDERTALKGFAG